MANKGEQTRKNIIENSLQLFSVKGYYNTSIKNILEATGLTKGGLYAHFKSKEDIWYAVYNEAVNIWKDIVFKELRGIDDPIKRINKLIENDMKCYIGENIFHGGCFFQNMLVELTGQMPSMSKQVLKGIISFASLIGNWLKEADEKGLLKKNLDYKEISNFIVISLNGASALYAAVRKESIWKETIDQLKFYINQLKKE